jgi:hypothetical protein
MINSTQRWIGAFVVAMTAATIGVSAQGTTQPRDDAPRPFSIRHAIAHEVGRQVRAESAAPQTVTKKPMSRGKKTAIAAAVVGGIGAAIGYSLEHRMDTPEGTGALLFGGIGAGLAAVIAWSQK